MAPAASRSASGNRWVQRFAVIAICECPSISITSRRLFGIPVYASSQISTSEVRGGSGGNCSWIGLCDMQQIAVGRRDDLTLKYSTDFKFDYDQTAVRATRRWDIQPINVAACDVLAGILHVQ